MFMRGLIEHERWQRTRHYLKQAAECTSRAIVSLEVADKPIKSVQQARSLERIGGETCSRLQKLEASRDFSNVKPQAGKFLSSAGAILVAILDATEEQLYNGHSQDRGVYIKEDVIKERARNLSEETFLEEDKKGFCQAWWRLEVLIKRDYIRRRRKKKSPVLQLLPLGVEVAKRLRGMAGLESTVPAGYVLDPVSHANHSTTRLCVHEGDTPTDQSRPSPTGLLPETDQSHGLTTANRGYVADMENALYSNDKGLDGVVMLVDIQEWGGDRQGLGELCRLLEHHGVCYRTRKLPTGDYSWVWRAGGVEQTLPCLVERKRADDMARTIHEGRFFKQINKMLAWKQNFSSQDLVCQLHYILERRPEEYVVRCADACQGVGRCGYPTLTQVQEAIADLRTHPDLEVSQTDSMESTVSHLVSLTAALKERIDRGDFDVLHFQKAAGADTQAVKNLPDVPSHLDKPDVATDVSNDVCVKSNKSAGVGIDTIQSQTDKDLALAIKRSKEEMRTIGIHNIHSQTDNNIALAIKLSKEEIGTSTMQLPTDIDDIEQSIVCNHEGYSQEKTTEIENKNILLETEFDADLAIAIERSKLAYKHSVEEHKTTEDLVTTPNVMSHDMTPCSTKMLNTCTNHSPCKHVDNDDDYLPRISRKRLLKVDDNINTGETDGNVSNSTDLQEHTNLQNSIKLKFTPSRDYIDSNIHNVGCSKPRTKRRSHGRVYLMKINRKTAENSCNRSPDCSSDTQVNKAEVAKQVNDMKTVSMVTNLTDKIGDADNVIDTKTHSGDYKTFNFELNAQQVESVDKDTGVMDTQVRKPGEIKAIVSKSKLIEMQDAEYNEKVDHADGNDKKMETKNDLGPATKIGTEVCVANVDALMTTEIKEKSETCVGAHFSCGSNEQERISVEMKVQNLTWKCEDSGINSDLDVDANNKCDSNVIDKSCVNQTEYVNEMEYDSSEDLFLDIDEAKTVSTDKTASTYGVDTNEQKLVDISQTNQFLGLAIDGSGLGNYPEKSNENSFSNDEFSSQESLPDLTIADLSGDDVIHSYNGMETHVDTMPHMYQTTSEQDAVTDSEHQKHTCNLEIKSNVIKLDNNHNTGNTDDNFNSHIELSGLNRTSEPNDGTDYEEQINTLLTILPQLSRSRALTALTESGGDIENCITMLLEENISDPSPVIDLTDSQNV